MGGSSASTAIPLSRERDAASTIDLMATNRADPADEDPIDEEMRLVLADPDIQASLDEFEAAEERGEPDDDVSNDEVRRMLGLPPSRFPRGG
jgi:hypothetical protein